MKLQMPGVRVYSITRADFPEQDWSEWRRKEIDESRDDDGATIDTNYLAVRPCCIHCATWICTGCYNYRRSRAARRSSQYCHRCGSRKGFFVAVRHVHDHEPLRAVPFAVPYMSIEEVPARVPETVGKPAHPIDQQMNAIDLMATYRRFPMHVPEEAEIMSHTEDEERKVAKQTAEELLDASAVDDSTVDIKPDRKLVAEFPPRNRYISKMDAQLPPSELEKSLATEFDEKEAAEEEAESEELRAIAKEYKRVQESYSLKQIEKALQEAMSKANQGYPRIDGDVVILGPGVFVDPKNSVICWEGENYYRHDGPMAPVETGQQTKEERLAERRAYHRRDAMQWAVDIHKAEANTGTLDSTAQMIFNWLTAED